MEKERIGTKRNPDATILVALVLVTVVFRLWTVMEIHTGVDERDYWYSAKAITQGYSYPYVNHRTVRWGVIIPVAAQQVLTGTKANSYYLMPLFNAVAQSVLLYLLGKRLFNRRVGALAALFLVFFPYQIRSASQVRPEIFSITYILLFLSCFYTYLSLPDGKKARLMLALSSTILFVAYMTKITTLFFMPASFIAIGLFRRNSFFRDSFLFGGILLALFLAETLAYNHVGDYPLGQLSVILSNHVADMQAIDGFLDVFSRYSLENLQLYWQVPLWLFMLASAHSLYRLRDHHTSESDRNSAVLAIFGLTFIFFVTFTPSSINPLKMAEPFVNRYFSAALPCIFLLIARYADLFLRRFGAYETIARMFVPVVASGIAAFCVVGSLPFLPSRVREYVHSPFDGEYHPFHLNVRYSKLINDAAHAGEPIVAIDTNGGNDALWTASWYFLDDSLYVDGMPPAPEFSFESGGKRYASLGGIPLSADGEALAVVRDPFRVLTVRAADIAGLDTESFPEK